MCEFTGKTQPMSRQIHSNRRRTLFHFPVYRCFHFFSLFDYFQMCALRSILNSLEKKISQCLVRYTAAKMDKRISEKTEWILYAEGFLHCGPLIQLKARLAGCQIYCLIQQCPHVSATFWAHRTWGNTGARKIAYNCASVHRNVTHFLAYSYFRSQLVSAANFASEVLHRIGKPQRKQRTREYTKAREHSSDISTPRHHLMTHRGTASHSCLLWRGFLKLHCPASHLESHSCFDLTWTSGFFNQVKNVLLHQSTQS